MTAKGNRPKNLDLLRIRFPINAIVSILHRASGLLLFLSLPMIVYLLDLSLRGPNAYADVAVWLQQPFVKLVSFILLWSALHHLSAGIRFLLIDLDWGVDIVTARKTARIVIIGAVAAAVILGVGWLL